MGAKKHYQDERWYACAKKVKERAKFTCERCGATQTTLHVHHINYRQGHKPWEYKDHELMCLCERCHDWVEKAIWQMRKMVVTKPTPQWLTVDEKDTR
jgi:5-methylcytosine-specific restriction endonuclease McrA